MIWKNLLLTSFNICTHIIIKILYINIIIIIIFINWLWINLLILQLLIVNFFTNFNIPFAFYNLMWLGKFFKRTILIFNGFWRNKKVWSMIQFSRATFYVNEICQLTFLNCLYLFSTSLLLRNKIISSIYVQNILAFLIWLDATLNIFVYFSLKFYILRVT